MILKRELLFPFWACPASLPLAGRSSPTSPQERAMGGIIEKGAPKVALFLLASQSSLLCGLSGYALMQPPKPRKNAQWSIATQQPTDQFNRFIQFC